MALLKVLKKKKSIRPDRGAMRRRAGEETKATDRDARTLADDLSVNQLMKYATTKCHRRWCFSAPVSARIDTFDGDIVPTLRDNEETDIHGRNLPGL